MRPPRLGLRRLVSSSCGGVDVVGDVWLVRLAWARSAGGADGRGARIAPGPLAALRRRLRPGWPLTRRRGLLFRVQAFLIRRSPLPLGRRRHWASTFAPDAVDRNEVRAPLKTGVWYWDGGVVMMRMMMMLTIAAGSGS